MSRLTLYHGGISGLDVGDLLVPSPPHQEDGCPICVARAEGRTATARDMRRWAQQMGPKGAALLAYMRGVPDDAPIDPPSARKAVYVTTNKMYATWYAARSRGDLYRVEPVGNVLRTTEDNFRSFTVPEARIVKVLRRDVRLSAVERRKIMRAWKMADRAKKKQRLMKP